METRQSSDGAGYFKGQKEFFCSFIKETMLPPAYLFGKIFGVLPVSFSPSTLHHAYSKEIGTKRKHGITAGKMRPHIVRHIFKSRHLQLFEHTNLKFNTASTKSRQ
jgi:hypothetical protein